MDLNCFRAIMLVIIIQYVLEEFIIMISLMYHMYVLKLLFYTYMH